MRRLVLLVLVSLVLAACASEFVPRNAHRHAPIGPDRATTVVPSAAASPTEPGAPFEGLSATVIAEGFETPVDVAGTIGDPRLFVVEKKGVIRVVLNGQVLDEPFLDIESQVLSVGNEQGLVTLELHPQFAANGRAFLVFTDHQGDAQIYEYTVDSANPDRLDPTSARRIIEVPQPNQYHQSGSITFGPAGYLWLSLGDGGGQFDPHDNGQNPKTLPGTVLRLDVDVPRGYAIPPDNPFVAGKRATDGLGEIWAYGLRNPWRISIDRPTGRLYIADVSQDGNEEINVVPITGGGYNFGWPIKEGTECLDDDLCGAPGFFDPVYEYPHDGTCAIVGGDVYRGASIPELHGHYFFADHCGGWIRSIVYDGHDLQEHAWVDDLGRVRFITSMSTDGNGEIVITTLTGELLRLEAVRG